MDDESMMLEMIDLFLEKAPEMIDNIENSCKEEDWEKVEAAIHRFKPNLDYMGMAATKELIEEIETDAKNKENLETLGERFKKVKERCFHAYEFLKEERANLKKS